MPVFVTFTSPLCPLVTDQKPAFELMIFHWPYDIYNICNSNQNDNPMDSDDLLHFPDLSAIAKTLLVEIQFKLTIDYQTKLPQLDMVGSNIWLAAIEKKYGYNTNFNEPCKNNPHYLLVTQENFRVFHDHIQLQLFASLEQVQPSRNQLLD